MMMAVTYGPIPNATTLLDASGSARAKGLRERRRQTLQLSDQRRVQAGHGDLLQGAPGDQA